jgi:hypothetical protein
MDYKNPNILVKSLWSLPWLSRYPFWRARQFAKSAFSGGSRPRNLIFIVANHFEPAWAPSRIALPISHQISRVKTWCQKAKQTGTALRDFDNMPFRHTNFYPAEQYDYDILDLLAGLQSDGFGDVEVHLHHGVGRPDTPENLTRALVEFRDTLAEEHKCLSQMADSPSPMYAFVHGNYALSNSAGGRYCGVDCEMRILGETGCYIDMTLPSAPDQSQVGRINAIYECGGDTNKRRAHRSGPSVRAGRQPKLPLILTGPLVFDWRKRDGRLPKPRIDGGVLAENYPLDLSRLFNWVSAGVSVEGRPEWAFLKLYCHGFFPQDQEHTIGEPVVRFFDDLLNLAHRTGDFKIHFATAREAFNIAMAAANGESGEPGMFRDYLLSPIMAAQKTPPIMVETELAGRLAV